jgi:NADH-quinone oxidoreductase subunit H
MKFSMFFIAEYANMVTACALMSTLFFGGWDIPFTSWDNSAPHSGWKTLATLAAFLVKVLFFLFLFMWIRWTLPRFRYDQLMSLGWRFMLPLALAYIVIIASVTLALDAAGMSRGVAFGLVLFALNVVLVVLLFFLLDRGRIISPASARARAEEIRRLQELRRRSPLAATLTPETGD